MKSRKLRLCLCGVQVNVVYKTPQLKRKTITLSPAPSSFSTLEAERARLHSPSYFFQLRRVLLLSSFYRQYWLLSPVPAQALQRPVSPDSHQALVLQVLVFFASWFLPTPAPQTLFAYEQSLLKCWRS